MFFEDTSASERSEKSQIGHIVLQTFMPMLSKLTEKTLSLTETTNSKSSIQRNSLIQSTPNVMNNTNQKKSDNLLSLMKSTPNLIQQRLQKSVRHILKSNYMKLINEYQGTTKKFTDPQFTATGKSLGGRWATHDNWKRISDIMPNAVFVQENMSPGDILQGQIGDCYFLSALAALAEDESRIKNIFPNLRIQQNGIYMARILHRGVLTQVVVDDYIPVDEKNEPLMAKAANGNEIWVMILEKCWAKLFKSYNAIIGGLPHEVLHAFSGAPTLFNSMPKSKAEKEQLFQQLYLAQKNGAVLCCGTKFDEQIEKKGLVVGHAYTLLQIHKHPYRMVKIRNPWGQKQWTGRASEKDLQFWRKISDDDKKTLGHTNNNDGIFFMLWQDFSEVFNMIDMCLINDNASYLSRDGTYECGQGKVYEIQLHNPGKVVISVSQQNMRSFKSDLQKKKGYSKTTIVLGKYNQNVNGHEYSFQKSSQYHLLPDHYMTFQNLQAGKYVVYVQCNWVTKVAKQATIAVYSEPQIWLKDSELDPQTFLFKVFMDHARRNHKKHQVLSIKPYEWMCSDILLNKSGYGYSAFHLDPSSKYKLGIEIDEKNYTSKNLQLVEPYAGHGNFKTIVCPGEDLIILFKVDPFKALPSITIPPPRVVRLTSG